MGRLSNLYKYTVYGALSVVLTVVPWRWGVWAAAASTLLVFFLSSPSRTSLLAKIGTLPGDILLISSFLSYVGCFTRRYREELQHKLWLPSFRKMDVSSWRVECLSSSPS